MISSVTLEDDQHKIIEDYFYDEPDLPWVPLPVHTFEQTPCNVIIPQIILDGSNSSYYESKLYPEIYCPLDLDKMMATLRQSVLDRVAGYKSQHSGVTITQRFYVVLVIEQICRLFIWLRQTKYKRR
jgi:hypothetical protein